MGSTSIFITSGCVNILCGNIVSKDLMKMSVKKLKAYKETIIEKIETHLPELCDDIDKVIAIKEKNKPKKDFFKGLSGSSKGIIKW